MADGTLPMAGDAIVKGAYLVIGSLKNINPLSQIRLTIAYLRYL